MLTATDLNFWARHAGTQAVRQAYGGNAASPATTQAAAPAGVQDSVELSAQARLLLGLMQAMAGGDAGAAPRIFGPPGIRLVAPGAGELTGAGEITAVAGGAIAGAAIEADPAVAVTTTVAITAAGGASTDIRAGTGENRISAYAVVGDRARGASLNIASGHGKDLISAESAGQLGITSGGGDDQVAASFGAFADIDLGEGDNLATVMGNFGTLRSGGGNDVVAVQGQGNTVSTGAGNDTISGAQWVNAGTGRDSIILGDADLSTIAFRAGDGQDEITLPPIGSGMRATASRAVIGDGSGAHEAAAIGIAAQDDFRMGVPQAGEEGHGEAHAALVLQDIAPGDVTASLSGTDLTLRMAATGDSITIRNYSPGRVTFVFDDRSRSGLFTGTRSLPGLG